MSFAFATAITLAAHLATAAPPPTQEVTIEASPITPRVERGKEVTFSVQFANTTATHQTLAHLVCGWNGEWTSTDPTARARPVICSLDIPERIDLAPGEKSKVLTVELDVSRRASLGKHELQLDFTPFGTQHTISGPTVSFEVVDGPPLPTPTATLTVEAAPDAQPARRGHDAAFQVQVINTTAKRYEFEHTTCSWSGAWHTDDPTIQGGPLVCSPQPLGIKIVLEPGDRSAVFTIVQRISPKASLGKHELRLGYAVVGTHDTVWTPKLSFEVVP